MEAIVAIIVTLIAAFLIGAYIAIRVTAEDEELKEGDEVEPRRYVQQPRTAEVYEHNSRERCGD